MKQSIYRLLGRGVFPIGAYCSPQSACEYGGVRYPDRIVQQQYDLLAQAGVNLFYGHSEVAGGGAQADVPRALDCAARAGAGYLARFEEAEEYCALGFEHKGYPDYRTLSRAEREKLDDRFARSLEKLAGHPAFFGISFRDEPGTEMFPGIAAGKRVFDKVCGDKFFYVNMFPYYITPEQYQYSFGAGTTCTWKEFETDRTNLERYRDFAEEFLDTVQPEIFSYDAYPFMTLGQGAETGVHEVLYDMPQYLAQVERERGVPFWMFMQEGGKWEGDLNVRIPNSAEHRLQFSVGLAFGAKGLQLFPCCYPNDWLHDGVCRAGLVDRLGNPTEFLGYVARETKQVRAVGALLLGAKWKGMMKAGRFCGLLPGEQELAKIRWNECIFRGNLPGEDQYLLKEHGRVAGIEATSQAIAGCFEKGDKKFIYLVNNSATTAAHVTVKFSAPTGGTLVRNGEPEAFEGRELKIAAMAAGEGVLVLPEPREVV